MKDQPIHPWPVDPPPDEKLSSVLERINAKYGTFRSLNQDALLHDRQTSGVDVEAAEDDEVVEKSAREKFFTQRKELAQLVSYVHSA